MDPTTSSCFRPRSDSDWERWKPLFTRLYKEENRPLPEVMRLLKDEHNFWASEKMFKNKIKAWNLRKYLKEDEAKMIVDGDVPGTSGSYQVGDDSEDIRERAERSLKRKRARQRAHTQPSPLASESSPAPLPPSPTTNGAAMVPYSAARPSVTLPPLENFNITDISERFLLDLRKWTHYAFIHGSWDTALSSQQ